MVYIHKVPSFEDLWNLIFEDIKYMQSDKEWLTNK